MKDPTVYPARYDRDTGHYQVDLSWDAEEGFIGGFEDWARKAPGLPKGMVVVRVENRWVESGRAWVAFAPYTPRPFAEVMFLRDAYKAKAMIKDANPLAGAGREIAQDVVKRALAGGDEFGPYPREEAMVAEKYLRNQGWPIESRRADPPPGAAPSPYRGISTHATLFLDEERRGDRVHFTKGDEEILEKSLKGWETEALKKLSG